LHFSFGELLDVVFKLITELNLLKKVAIGIKNGESVGCFDQDLALVEKGGEINFLFIICNQGGVVRVWLQVDLARDSV